MLCSSRLGARHACHAAASRGQFRARTAFSGVEAELAASAPKSAALERWPDGTPKRFQEKELWKNWIAWDAPFRNQTDELNRRRHFFFEMDDKGALWRLELDQPGVRFGQLRHPKAVDSFLAHVRSNRTGLYTEAFPFVSLRTHEHYFVRWAATGSSFAGRHPAEAPIVFNDLRDGELRHIVAGEVATSLTTQFDPGALCLSKDGRFLHPVWTRKRDGGNDGGEALESSGPGSSGGGGRGRQRIRLLAKLDVVTSQEILTSCEAADNGDGDLLSLVLRWGVGEFPLQVLSGDDDEKLRAEASPDCVA